jgi:GIY-YIG catalytic domain
MIDEARTLLRQSPRRVADLTAADFPDEPGIYAWSRSGKLFYVGESRRGLRSRLWGNHIRGNARGSTLRNKVAKCFGFPPIGVRAYGSQAEQEISSKLRECDLSFLVVPIEVLAEAQGDLISTLDPPMNDHPGHVPRWRIDDVRDILAIESAVANTPPTRRDEVKSDNVANSQRVTLTDIRAGRIRFPWQAKRYFPNERGEVRVVLKGVQLDGRYDPRTGPDKARSAVLLVGKANLGRHVEPDEVLSVTLEDGIVSLY